MSNQTAQVYALAIATTVEVIGIAVIGFGIAELQAFGNNPVSGTILIPVGSVIIAIGGVVAGKLVKGLELVGSDDSK